MHGVTGAHYIRAVVGKGTAGHVSLSTNDQDHRARAVDSTQAKRLIECFLRMPWFVL
jgi:hypothetical protein